MPLLSTVRTYTLGEAVRLQARYCPAITVKGQYRRLNSHAAASSSAEKLAVEQDPHELARARLRPLIETFEAPVDYAVAYGSGVVHQANRSTAPEDAPLTDLIVATPSAQDFHRANLRQNPSHYPLMARIIGSSGISWLQEHWGARVWYVTMVKLKGMHVKYGVISTSSLKRDLSAWETLYISGRLQKPHLPLIAPAASLASDLQHNLRSALCLALLLLPARFTEMQLWEQIAGISYAGDPRMSVPGAENPEKVKNIVRGEGAQEGFRAMYGGLLKELDGVTWMEGQDTLEQSSDPAYLASLLLRLPDKLLHPVARHYRPTIVGSLVSSDVRVQRASETIKRSEVPRNPEFWAKVATQDRIREVVLNEVRGVIRRPALTQSIKGLFTAGFTKSFHYSLAKFRKWLKAGRQKSG